MSHVGTWRYLGEVLIGIFLLEAVFYAGGKLVPMVGQMLGLLQTVDGGDHRYPPVRRSVAGRRDRIPASDNVRVMFFPEEQIPCRLHYEGRFDGSLPCPQGSECQFSHDAPHLNTLLSVLAAVRSSLDVCVYMMSSYELCKAIIAAHERGVIVRIITDGNYCDDSKSKIGRFRAKRIPVRSNQPGFLMHHKFLILDDRLLINGSFNWTWQAITGNNENLMINDNPVLVQQYREEYERLWNKFGPYTNPAINGLQQQN